ncbi:hypothetical protein Desaci_1224 [Desulfosporosinus acidiphilus SJ4]|uniref:Uncharacterized protein n=1 Tax=Desulfosporosinus acidiphilus (strain DSM 22704 / JCM 16185 / SJ4) TaxID=646529 RepID=I4D380_DESAJ|nr:hypothetical protein Desaci_1224 [Desulfosporosinus acidiphilus SJ4]
MPKILHKIRKGRVGATRKISTLVTSEIMENMACSDTLRKVV